MARSSRQIVRSAVGLAAVAPAIGLIVLAIALAADGGFSGFLAGVVVAGIALLLIVFALIMTYAPVSIHKLLRSTDEARREREGTGGTNGHGEPGTESARDGPPPGDPGR